MPGDTLQEQLEQAVQAHRSGDLDQAEARYRRVLRVRPRQFDALHLLGMIEHAKGRHVAAELRLNEAISANAKDAAAYSNRSIIRLAKGNAAGSLADAEKAAELSSGFAAAHANKGNALLALGRVQDAIAAYETAIRCDGTQAQAWSGRSAGLVRMGRYSEAADSARTAVGYLPGLADGWSNLGLALQSMGDLAGASENYERALAIDAGHPDSLYNRGIMRHALGDYVRALEDMTTACRVKRFDGDAGQILHTRMNICDWNDFESTRTLLGESIRRGEMVSVPFSVLTLFDDPTPSKIAARAYTEQRHPAMPPMVKEPGGRGDRIHIAYMSADFRDHPASYLMVDCIAGHDRARFKVTGLQIGPPDMGAMGARIREACDVFIEAAGYSDEQIAALISDTQVDVLIDMMGHTRNARTGVLSRRPAPVQVNFLGYAGTMGAPYMDYIVADQVVAHIAENFDEKLCLMPDTYYPTSALPDVAVAPTRASARLPDNAFVFSSFCNNWKITPDVFAIWMRLLGQVDNSVLWLLANNEHVQTNLRRAANGAGVDPARLIFAPRAGHAEHIARQGLADVMLDTFPYGAHTTTTDALWVGLPLVTRSGQSFYSRVARSVLKAANLERYATDTTEAYEAMALDLATNPESLKAAREAFATARQSPLFDTARYVANIEAGYARMFERAQGGLPPESFAVRA